jgi:hypothetical protein
MHPVTKSLKILAGAGIILLAACSPANGAGKSGGQASRTFDVPAFDRVRNDTSINVVIDRGAQAVAAEGSAELVNRLELTVRDGELKIDTRDERGWHMGWRKSRAELRVRVPMLSGVSTNGSGDMRVNGGGGERFQADIAGSGNMVLAGINARQVAASIRGSGDMQISGRAEATSLAIKGSGNIDAAKLDAATARIAIDGSGDISARATRDASVAISGSGNVLVQGTERCQKSVSGSGEITCRQ